MKKVILLFALVMTLATVGHLSNGEKRAVDVDPGPTCIVSNSAV